MSELCEVCRSIELRPPTLPLKPIMDALLEPVYTTGEQSSSPQIHDHYPSFQLLQESANRGCPLCALLVRTLLNADKLINVGHWKWGGIILLWYRTTIELEYNSLSRRRIVIEPLNVIESCPTQWDKLEARVHNLACLGPGELSTITDPENSAAPYITGRPLPAFDSDATYRIIKDWINTCCQHHSPPDCPRHIDEILPTRIIDVGSSEDSVVSLNVSTNMRGTYVALSHVWGAQIHKKLTMKVLEEWNRGINVGTLPRSFQDAINVTRKLGFRYIWIDALCIVQDSPKDWQLESSKMGDIFKNAFLTIAVSATAQSANGFLTRHSLYDSSCKLKVSSTGSKSCGHIWVKPHASSKEKIDTRAWCFQENALSTRLLTFALEECFFECRQKYRISESGVYNFKNSRYFRSGGNLINTLSWATNEFQNPKGLDKSRREKICQLIAQHWYAMIGDPADRLTRSGYGNRHLTFRSDKLPALSGLAHEVHRVIQCKYLAGIWECHILGGLLWRRVQLDRLHSEPSESRPSIPQEFGDPQAPSWSWAASNGPLQYAYPDFQWQHTDGINMIGSGTTLAGSDPMGRVSAGWITLNGPLLEICCIQDGLSHSDYRNGHSYLVTSLGKEEVSHEVQKLCSDVMHNRKELQNALANFGIAPAPVPENFIGHAQFDKDDYFSSSVTCLLFCKPNAKSWAYGLMLQSTGRDGEYQRVGFWEVGEARPDLAPLWARFNRRTIIII